MIFGGEGSDSIFSSASGTLGEGDATDGGSLWGGNGDDWLRGDGGTDILGGGSGIDIIYGFNGDDTIFGGAGGDDIWGDNGNDRIYGGNGDDLLNGGAGNDTIVDGAGDDVILGGDGADLLVFGNIDGANRVFEFVFGEDKIDLSAFNITFADLNIVDNALITIDGVSDFSIALNATTGATLTAADFVF